MNLAVIIQYLVSGLTVGGAYGLTALGFTIIFNATGVVNFAQGEFVMLGGMASVFFYKILGWPLALAVPAAAILAAAVAAAIERGTIRPLRDAAVIRLIIITIGASIVVRGAASLVWGKDVFSLPHFTSGKPIKLLGASVLPQSLWVLGAAGAILLALKWFFSRTILGKAMAACSVDRKAARLVGVNVEGLVLLSFAVSGFVGAIGGAVLAPMTMTSYDRGILLGLKGFSACILGGLGNPFGAAFGGLVIGVLESFGAGYISSAYKDAFAFMILLVLLFVRPQGLFGAKSWKRV